MGLGEAWQEMVRWIRDYSADGKAAILWLALASAVYLFIRHKEIRTRILIPLLVLVLLLINPILYAKVYHKLRYWRLFWMFPDCLLIGWAGVDLCGRCRGKLTKGLCLATICLVIAAAGKNVYSARAGYFSPADSLYKVSANTRMICEAILADNPHPKCIFEGGIKSETRQYSGEIEQLYGRDIDGYIMKPSKEVRAFMAEWKTDPPDNGVLFRYARENGYTHVCVYPREGMEEAAEENGYSVLTSVNSWTIYRRDNGNGG